jgi:SAM-dependent methyltransferase/uncharacterized protein YbaR (Trm112 family)
MKEASASRFVCPACGGPLRLTAARKNEGRVEEGAFDCPPCGRTYPIRRFIPRFAGELSGTDQHTAGSFGFKWAMFSKIDAYYKKNFLDELAPLDLGTFFIGKSVLDAGTGVGIPAYCMAELGAREVFAFDIMSAIEDTYRNNLDHPQVTVAQADIYAAPFKQASFDAVVCVGVLQHLPDYRRAVDSLLSFVKPGGHLILWVYASEGNGFVRWVVEPLRKSFTRRLPVKVCYGLSWVIGVLFHVVAVGIYGPLNRVGFRRLPMNDYIRYRARFNLPINVQMVFDQLLAPLSHLYSRAKIEALMDRPELEDKIFRHHNRNSWTVIARRRPG